MKMQDMFKDPMTAESVEWFEFLNEAAYAGWLGCPMTTPGIQTPAHAELRRFIDHVPALGWSALPDGSLDYVNLRFRDYTGLSLDELYGSGWKSAIHRDDVQPLESWSQELLESREAGTTEVRLRRFDGSYRWFLVFANPLQDESGSVVAWYGTNIDIEDRKQAEEALRAREQSWLQIVDNIPGLVATMSATGEVEFLNRQTLEYFGKTNDDLKNWALGDAVHPDDLPRVIQARIKSIEEGGIYDIEHRCRRADGVYRWFQVRGLPVRDAEDRITAWYLLLTDIDDRKQAEEALQSNERSLSLIINTMPAFAWSARPDGSLEFVNERWLNFTGLSMDKARDWGWTSAVHPDDVNRLTDYWQSILATGEQGEIEARFRRFDGEYRWFLFRASALRDDSGAIVRWYGTNTDIEDRKSAERELKRSESFLAEGQRISLTGSFCWSVRTDKITWSKELYRIFEFEENLPVTLARIKGRVHPDDLPSVQDIMERLRHADDDFEYEHRLLMPDKSVKHIHLFAHAIRDIDGQVEYIGAAQDVTRRRVIEEQLRQREHNLRQITQTIPGMLWSATPEGEVDYCNRPLLEFTGMTPEQAHGWGWTALIYPDDRDRQIKSWRSCLASGTPLDTEARMRRFDGSYRWFLFRANPLRDESGKIVKWYGTTIDIEDRKRREEALRASELSWRQIIDNIPGLVNASGATGDPTFFNRQELEYFGKTNEELKDWGRIDVFHPEDLPSVIEAWATSIETGQVLDIEARLRRADGVYRWFQTRAVPARDAEGKISDWYCLHTDIEDRKCAEEMLRQSEAELRTITETVRQPIVVLSPDGFTLYANQVALDNTGLTLDEVIKEGFLERASHPDDMDRMRDERRIGLLEGVPFDLEMRFFKHGEYRWQLVQYNALTDESGQIIRWYVTATDIDDRKRAEEMLRQSEEDLRTITDAIRQPIFVLAPDGTRLYANRVALDDSGLTLDEVIKEGFLSQRCHPDDMNRVFDELRIGLLEGVPFDVEMRLLDKSGEYRWNLIQYNPLKDESGQIIRWYATATDIDDRKKAEERLRIENVKLAQERVYLEEQIRSEMGFEHIIGNSP
ncbi:MAG: PAS domain-containing protein, partial [Acidobacteriaceae bacterium]|nr:PAS domain-containing protein [Acidobacteriaceae bacterium]